MNGYSPKDIINEPISISAPSDQVISNDTGLSAGGAVQGLRIMLTVANTSGSITYRLQQRTLDTWTDLAGANASVTQSGDGELVLKQLALITADQPNFPLSKQIRVVANGAGDADVTRMVILQEL